MTPNNTKLLRTVTIGLLLIGSGGGLFYAYRQSTYTAAVDIEATPLSSSVSIDGHHANQGVTKLKPGTLTITVSLSGFNKFTKRVAVVKGDNKYVGAILKSNNADTANWYETHPADQTMAEKIASKQFDATSQKQVAAEPFLKEIPYIAAGFEFKVDYGVPAPGSNKPIIIIQADTQTARADALTWIRSRGYDPATLNIVYTTSDSTNNGD